MDIDLPEVRFTCVKIGSKLRIRIITKGYNNEANCQFPKNIRQEGKYYKAPAYAVTLAKGPAGKFFYRVKSKLVQEIGIKVDKIFKDDSDDSCAVCLDQKRELVLVPCGHFNLCKDCVDHLLTKNCPYCRQHFNLAVPLDQIQFD